MKKIFYMEGFLTVILLQCFWFTAIAQKEYLPNEIPTSWKTPISHAEISQFYYLADGSILAVPFDLDSKFFSDYAPGTSRLIALNGTNGTPPRPAGEGGRISRADCMNTL